MCRCAEQRIVRVLAERNLANIEAGDDYDDTRDYEPNKSEQEIGRSRKKNVIYAPASKRTPAERKAWLKIVSKMSDSFFRAV